MKTNKTQTEKAKYILKGQNGQLYVYEDKIEITRKGIAAFAFQGLKGKKTIPISEIKSIQIKPRKLALGYIQFGISGSIESKGGVNAANYDENTITFSDWSINKYVDEIKLFIENIMIENKKQNTIIQATSNADEIKKYKELLDLEIITQEEFDAKKKQLLGI